MTLPTKTEVEAVLFRHRCWLRGRIMEAAFGLLLGASRGQAVAQTRVPYATISKLCRALAELGLKVESGRKGGPGLPVRLDDAERVFVHRAAELAKKPFADWMRDTVLDRAAAELEEDPPQAPAHDVDWAKAALLAASDAEPRRAPRPETRKAAPAAVAPAPAKVRTPRSSPTKELPHPSVGREPHSIEEPREPEVAHALDRRDLLRKRFRAISQS